MWPNQQFSADLVTFTEEMLKGKLHFFCGVTVLKILVSPVMDTLQSPNLISRYSFERERERSPSDKSSTSQKNGVSHKGLLHFLCSVVRYSNCLFLRSHTCVYSSVNMNVQQMIKKTPTLKHITKQTKIQTNIILRGRKRLLPES